MEAVVDNRQKFEDFRAKYPIFTYDSYSWAQNGPLVLLHFKYSFSPSDIIESVVELYLPEDVSTDTIRENEDYIFRIGLLNALSYWKAYCSPQVKINCGNLKDGEILWWQDLWYEGMGEFRYRNGLLEVKKEDWVTFLFENKKNQTEIKHDFSNLYGNLIAFTGGKDSSLALGILKNEISSSETFSINPPSNLKIIKSFFGYDNSPETIVSRKMGSFILRANESGALNGHTPFSAIVAMLGVFVASLRDKKYVIVSNEASADEETVKGLGINHQYSKSLVFEKKFQEYCRLVWPNGPEYFSLLRPLSEVGIFKMFKEYEGILPEISSCNIKNKDGAWCGKCGKCLFAFLMFSAEWNIEFAKKITGRDMFGNVENLAILKELTGFSPTKPFECVGTKDESASALRVIIEKDKDSLKEPALALFLKENLEKLPSAKLFEEIATSVHESSMPEKFLKLVLDKKNG